MSLRRSAEGPRSVAGRLVPEGTRMVSFVARSLERLRGFDRFWHAANALLRARADVVCVIVGDPLVQRGLDVSIPQPGLSCPASRRVSAGRSRSALVPGPGDTGQRRGGAGRERPASGPRPALSGGSITAGGDGRGMRCAGLGHRAPPRGHQPRPDRTSGGRRGPRRAVARRLPCWATWTTTGPWATRRPRWCGPAMRRRFAFPCLPSGSALAATRAGR